RSRPASDPAAGAALVQPAALDLGAAAGGSTGGREDRPRDRLRWKGCGSDAPDVQALGSGPAGPAQATDNGRSDEVLLAAGKAATQGPHTTAGAKRGST